MVAEKTSEQIMDYERDLEDFGSGDDGRAGPAFERLMNRVREPLLWFLRGRGLDPEDCDEVLQDVSFRVWQARAGFEPKGPGGWWVFVRKTAVNCSIDHARKKGKSQDGFEGLEEVPDEDMPYLDVLVSLAEDRQHLYETADACWLGLPRDAKGNRLRLLAVQMHLLHGMDWKDIARILKIKEMSNGSALDRWAADPAVLKNVAYSEMYGANVPLTGYLLGKKDARPSDLDAIMRAAQGKQDLPCPEGWTWPDVQVVIWRHRYGFSSEKIILLAKNALDKDQIETIFGRCRKQYPFGKIATRLNRSYQAIGQGALLGQTGLWRRIVFQYSTADELPHLQILDRTTPAADVLGVKMTTVTLNGWLSMGRLLAQLANFYQKENGNA